MREADMKCKVAIRLLSPPPDHFLLPTASGLPFPGFPVRLTRSRKVAAEDAFCCQFVAQTNRLRLSARSYFRDDSKNEERKLAAENFVGRNDQQ
jgi:hypothetical protein